MRKGKQTFIFDNPPSIISTGTIVGNRESEGPLGEYFDEALEDDIYGEKSFELAECKMQKQAIQIALKKADLTFDHIDAIVSGDLLNQIFASSFSARDFDAAFFGLYGACSTYGEGLIIASMLLNTGMFEHILVSSSSHFSSAERQYRFPLELGNQRVPTSQWTVTGAGSTILSNESIDGFPKITAVTAGKVIDYGITDVNNMGAAMAPAAYDTITKHFSETERNPNYYDLIATGDLGRFGSELLIHLCQEDGCTLPKSYTDCGKMIFSPEQKTFQGGSGAGCSNVVFNGFIYKQMMQNKFKKVLLVPTGALLSKDSPLQKQSIPSIAHAIAIEM
ncbi:MAG: stage V sporulation protein AD [Clostridia bacterium]